MQCPRCGCDRFHFRLPNEAKGFVRPITDQVIMLVNLLTDAEFKEAGDGCRIMIFKCTHCGGSFMKQEDETLQAAFARFEQRKTLRP